MSNYIFRSFGSGSSGNSYYLGTSEQGILIDAGISTRTIRSSLRQMGLDFAQIMGILITHDHADHIRAVGTLGERFHIPIYATRLIHEGIDRNYGVTEKLRGSKRFYEKGEPFLLGDFKVNTFTIAHDSTDCVAYVIDFDDRRFMIATDVGAPDETLCSFIETVDYLVIEANHDEELLLNGPYPSYLKSRIMSGRGHMSNQTCGAILAEHYNKRLKHVFLCHLSQENNEPDIAYNTIKKCYADIGVDVEKDLQLTVLDRTTPSAIFPLN